MKKEPLWREAGTAPLPKNSLPQERDVVVIGGGITGLTAAVLLKRSGKRVCVLEKSRVGSGETGHTSAHLTCLTDLRPVELIRNFGEEAARLAWQAGAAAIDLIEQLVEDLNIDCGFRRVPGFLHAALRGTEDESTSLREEADAAAKLGFAARYVPSTPVLGKPGVGFADQAIFWPTSYLNALAAEIQGDGSLVCEEAEVTEVGDRPTSVAVGDHRITCDEVVVATHVPLMGKSGLVSATLFQTKLYPYSTYIVGAHLPKGTIPHGLYNDTSDPYYYLRVHPDGDRDYAIFGGEDHKTGQADNEEERYARLTDAFHKIFPGIPVDRRWSGQVIETNDGLPYIGRTAERQFVGTGYAGNGLTFGTIAGLMAHDAVLNRPNPWQKLFDPSRKKVRGGLWDYLVENMDYPRYLVSGWLKPSQIRSADQLSMGEGAVLSENGKQVACSCDEHGHVTKVSAICTHMGCIVRWNKAEKTWDCPCHGSRFLANGEVIGGPAETPLEAIETPAESHA